MTDYAVFAWIIDVFIIPDYQTIGKGKELMSSIINHPNLQTISRWGLNTLDAHDFYKQYGSEQIKETNLYIERLIPRE